MCNMMIAKVWRIVLMTFFVNIGNTVEAKIPQGKKHFSTYLNSQNSNTFFLNAVDVQEVCYMISELNVSNIF